MLLTNAIIYLCLGAIWRTTDAGNIVIKCLMLGMAVWNFAAYLK